MPSAEKAKKDRNRSSLMPFRRGDSSKSQTGGDVASVTNRNPTPVISEETTRPGESFMQLIEPVSHASNMADAVGQQRTHSSTAMVNGTSPMENHADAAGRSAPVNQNPSSNGLATSQVTLLETS